MADVLSQGEIDALLSAISTGEMDADELKREDAKKRIRTYDFKRALRFSKDQVRGLTRLHENFSRLLTTQMSAQLRTYVQMSVASVDQLPYEEFIRSVPRRTILTVFEPIPMDGRLLMEVNPNVAYAMLDRLLGGKGEALNKSEGLTEIETKIISQLFQKMLYTYQEAWKSIEAFNPVMEELEENPQFLQLVSPNETVVVISLETLIGEASGMINFCLPHLVIEHLLPKLSVHLWMQEKHKERLPFEEESLKKNVKKAFLPISVELGRSSITIQEFLQLDKHDVIELNQQTDSPLTVCVGDEPKFLAQPGRQKKNMAVQITEKIGEGEHID
ncbi:flagellar motor switch protein FliM [Alteribacter aurantiacus]|uniref:flagellar motor switch protein FliM n=1 Tax=Alteribacter aurantiacus TaxID=254410 RepID=UPI000404F3D4|nr:flagellar motor switch protein FliM [Alteribacter aurantiacus]